MKLAADWTWNTVGLVPRRNVKIFQLHSACGARVQGGAICSGVDTDFNSNYDVDNCTQAGRDGYRYINLGHWEDIPLDTWMQEEFAYVNSTDAQTADGRLMFWHDGQPIHDETQLTWAIPYYTLHVGWADAWEESGSGQPYVYYDDVYIDNTWARVMIGDNAIFSNCTHKEIQIPSAWATGEITITINQGSFGNTDTAYLFVVDSDGAVSSGYEVTF